jgi:hypothetical protein
MAKRQRLTGSSGTEASNLPDAVMITIFSFLTLKNVLDWMKTSKAHYRKDLFDQLFIAKVKKSYRSINFDCLLASYPTFAISRKLATLLVHTDGKLRFSDIGLPSSRMPVDIQLMHSFLYSLKGVLHFTSKGGRIYEACSCGMTLVSRMIRFTFYSDQDMEEKRVAQMNVRGAQVYILDLEKKPTVNGR